MAEINFKILYFEKRPWWSRRYDIRMSAKGFMTPDEAWVASFWTVKAARKFVSRVAAKYDFKTVESAKMIHTEE